MKKISLLFMVLYLLLGMSGCSSDGDEPAVDVPVTTLNMMDENNGKTFFGETGMYINRSFNFVSKKWRICDWGTSVPFPSNDLMDMGVLTGESRVAVNHRYRIYDSEYIFTFPSGKVAYEIGQRIYQCRVASLLGDGDVHVGAVVEYISSIANCDELPKNGTEIGTLTGKDSKLAFDAKGAEEFCAFANEGEFYFYLSKGHLVITQLRNSLEGKHEIFLRKGSVFTKLEFTVV